MQTKDIAKQLRADADEHENAAKRLRRAAQELDPRGRPKRRKIVAEGRKQTINP